MRITAKTYVRNLVKDTALWRALQGVRNRSKIRAWEAAGRPVPPPHIIKQRILSTYVEAFKPQVFVETGTYFGDMIFAMKDKFSTIYSIELSEELAKKAQRRFHTYGYIEVVAGDSGEKLPLILGRLNKPCMFWLDGHYSGGITAKGASDTPVIKEVLAILDHKIKDHVILIDDARCFDGSDGYPAMDQLRELVLDRGPRYDFSVADDVIRIVPEKNRRG